MRFPLNWPFQNSATLTAAYIQICMSTRVTRSIARLFDTYAFPHARVSLARWYARTSMAATAIIRLHQDERATRNSGNDACAYDILLRQINETICHSAVNKGSIRTIRSLPNSYQHYAYVRRCRWTVSDRRHRQRYRKGMARRI